jgi:predicted DNA-binding protein
VSVITRLSRGLKPLSERAPRELREAHAAIDDVRVAVRTLEKIAKGDEKMTDHELKVINQQLAKRALERIKE